MPRYLSRCDVRQERSPFAGLKHFALLATFILLLLGALPGQSSLVHAQTGPNGKIAFVSDRDGGRDIYTMNADGTGVQKLTNLGQCSGPVWSPDGNRIAFTHRRADGFDKIYRINADGTGLSLLYITEAFPAHQRNPSWSPDGTKITFSHQGPNFENVFQQQIVVIDATTASTLANYSFDQAFFIVKKDTNPVWSPDGTKIAYLRNVGNQFFNDFEIIVLNLATQTRQQITSGGFSCTPPVWSPDSTRLAFTRVVSGGRYNRIAVINANGTNPLAPSPNLTTSDTNPVWSPDGTKIAFETTQYDQFSGIRVNGGIAVTSPGPLLSLPINSVPGAGFAPSWSPDSSRLAFAGSVPTLNQTNQSEIFAIDSDGDNSAQLTDVETLDSSPAWQPTQVDNTPVGANVTVNYGQIQLTFENVTATGITSVQLIDPNSLTLPAGYTIYQSNRPTFEITTSAQFTGAVTIGFTVPVTFESTLATLKVLHKEGNVFVDRTAAQPPPTFDRPRSLGTIYARVTSLSPFVIVQGSAQDQTAPAVTATTSTQPNVTGWYNSDTIVMLRAADEDGGSGVASITYAINGGGGGGGSDFSGGESSLTGGTVVNGSAVDIPVTAEGTTSITYFATDNTGNSSAEQTITLQLDKTTPSATATTSTQPNGAGWYNSDTTVMLRAADAAGGSGIASITYAINGGGGTVINSSEVDIPVTTDGTTSITYFTTDGSGNSSAEQTTTLKLDKTAPTVTIVAPTHGAVYTQNQVVAADYGCGDGLSAIATCVGTTPNGSSIDTASPGAKSFVVTATDNAGNMMQQTVSYTVQAPVSCATDVTHQIRFDADDIIYDKKTRRYKLTVTVTNKSATTIQGPISLVIDYLSDYGITLSNKSGVTACAAPLGSPYINLNVGSDGVLKRNEKVTVTLISDPTDKYNGPHSPRVQPRVLAGNGTR